MSPVYLAHVKSWLINNMVVSSRVTAQAEMQCAHSIFAVLSLGIHAVVTKYLEEIKSVK